MRNKYQWLGAALLVMGLVVQPGLTNRAWADSSAKSQDAKTQPKKSFKEDAKETWSGFKQGLKKTGKGFADMGHDIKKSATDSYDKAKKDFSHKGSSD